MAQGQLALPTWYRALAIVVGLISIALALLVLADPNLGALLLIFLLGFALFVIGVDRVVTGITGHMYSWMMPHVPGGGPGSAAGPSTPDMGAPPKLP